MSARWATSRRDTRHRAKHRAPSTSPPQSTRSKAFAPAGVGNPTRHGCPAAERRRAETLTARKSVHDPCFTQIFRSRSKGTYKGRPYPDLLQITPSGRVCTSSPRIQANLRFQVATTAATHHPVGSPPNAGGSSEGVLGSLRARQYGREHVRVRALARSRRSLIAHCLCSVSQVEPHLYLDVEWPDLCLPNSRGRCPGRDEG